jgi:hypothetical protein
MGFVFLFAIVTTVAYPLLQLFATVAAPDNARRIVSQLPPVVMAGFVYIVACVEHDPFWPFALVWLSLPASIYLLVLIRANGRLERERRRDSSDCPTTDD